MRSNSQDFARLVSVAVNTKANAKVILNGPDRAYEKRPPNSTEPTTGGKSMTIVRGGLIQMSLKESTEKSPHEIARAMLDAHVPLVDQAGQAGVQVLCFQEVFTQPYFCPSQDSNWYAAAEPIPDGPTVRLMQDLARKHQMVIVVPIYEEAMTGVYYNAAAVIDADGSYLGKYRKTHIPHVARLLGKILLQTRPSAYPVFQTRYCKLGVYICYDRHFPEGWRSLALNGADISSIRRRPWLACREYLWKLEQPAAAVANGVSSAPINRVGTEAPWNVGEFYGQSYFVNPRGQIEPIASRGQGRADRPRHGPRQVARSSNLWQFFRDRRPETYGPLTEIG